jgi:hypothetical protein
VIGLAVAMVLALAPAESETIDRMVELNRKAMADFETAEFDSARELLLDALREGERAGLDNHPVMARTFVHLGAVVYLGQKDRTRTVRYFRRALLIDGSIKLDPSLKIGELQSLFDAAAENEIPRPPRRPPPAPSPQVKRDAPPAAPRPDVKRDAAPAAPAPREEPGKREEPAPVAPADEDTGPDLPEEIVALDCPYPDEVMPDKKVTLRCAAAPQLGVSKVVLHYMGHEMKDFTAVTMSRTRKGWFEAVIPKNQVAGKSLRFYFEASDAAGAPVISNGRPQSPNLLPVIGADSRLEIPGPGGPGIKKREEENPLEFQEKLRYLDYGNRRVWVGLGVGSGFAYAIGGELESRVKSYADQTPGGSSVTGFGWAGLGHLAPEVGVQLNPHWAAALRGRHQWIPQEASVSKYTASGAHAVVARVIRYSRQNRFRFYGAAQAGGGEGVRMNIHAAPGMSAFKDTVLVGPVLVGGSAGIIFEIASRLSWVVEVDALLGFPRTGVTFDVGSALQVNFGTTRPPPQKLDDALPLGARRAVDAEAPKH